MKVNELRIGNYVNALEDNCNDGIGVVRVSGNQLSFFDNISSIIDLIEPIPLNEEWLLKFGFKFNRNYFEKNDVYIELCGEYFYFVGISISGIKYVHELQNSWRCIIGSELILSENDSSSD